MADTAGDAVTWIGELPAHVLLCRVKAGLLGAFAVVSGGRAHWPRDLARGIAPLTVAATVPAVTAASAGAADCAIWMANTFESLLLGAEVDVTRGHCFFQGKWSSLRTEKE